MIALVLAAGAALGWWAWKTRDAQALRLGDVAAVLAVLVGLRLFSRAETLPALIAVGGAGWWLWFRKRGDGQVACMSTEEASGLLGVPPNASADTVRAAHRRLVARVHPDVGGSSDLTARVNAARDVLLARAR